MKQRVFVFFEALLQFTINEIFLKGTMIEALFHRTSDHIFLTFI